MKKACWLIGLLFMDRHSEIHLGLMNKERSRFPGTLSQRQKAFE